MKKKREKILLKDYLFTEKYPIIMSLFLNLQIMTNQLMELKKKKITQILTGKKPDEEMNRTNAFNRNISLRTGKNLILIYKKSDVTWFAVILENSIGTCYHENKIDPGYTWDAGVDYKKIEVQNTQEADFFSEF